MAHAVLGAVIAQINGNSALAGASGAVMGEYIAQQMYPGIKREDLTEDQRQTISALGTLAAGLAGGLAGNSTADAVAGAQAGKNAVENNYLNVSDKLLKQQLEAKLANGTITDSEVKDLAELTQKDVVSDANLQNACASGASAGCINEIKLALAAKESYQGYAEYQTYYDLRDQFPEEMAKFGDLIGDYSRDLIKLVDQGYTPEQAKAKMSQDAAYAARYQQALEDVPGWAKIAMTIQDTAGIVYGAKAAGVSLDKLAANGATSATKNTGQGITGSLTGQSTKLPPNAGVEEIRSLTRENESASILAKNGYKVEQKPVITGAKNPDYVINGEVFDNIAPKTSSVRNIYDRALEKVNSGQTNNIVINLADTKASVSDLQKQFNDWPIKGLDKVIVIDQSGKPIQIK